MHSSSLMRDNLCKRDSIGGSDALTEPAWTFYLVWPFLNAEDSSENDTEIDPTLERF